MYKNENGSADSGDTGGTSGSTGSSGTTNTSGSANTDTSGTSETPDAADTSEKSYTMLVLENVTVIAVDRVLSEKGKVSSESPAYATLTLEVTPEQAMELNMAQAEGQLRAILRSPLDDKITELPGITLEEILREYINK
jgi:Flp pilus assembly protein CpaB